jgi:3-dehydroquinate dehydratase / shikimate dehydrogenase
VKPLLVETVTGPTIADLIAARNAATRGDMVELRLDSVSDLNAESVNAALDGRRLPVIATCRASWEGGMFAGSEEERRAILQAALDRGAEYVDIEWRAGFTDLLRSTGGARVVISSHDFKGVPSDLESQVSAMRATGAEIVKVAVMAERLCDNLPLRRLTRDGSTIAIAMGSSGIPSRVLAAHFGSCWTYAGNGVAPGQVAMGRMLDELRFRDISASTAVYGIVGTMTAESKSPGIHNPWFRAAGIDAVFVPLPTPDFADFLAFADALPVAGAGVTIPFKLDALQAAVRTDDYARRVGATNTLKRCADGWEATNTDVAGFLGPLADRDLGGARVSVLGAGGAARAVIVALNSVGAIPTICARRLEQAREVAGLGAAIGEWPPRPQSWDILVNCTPLGGMSNPDASPLPGGPFDGRLVYDLNYKPPETRLLKEARAAGCATLNGWPMLQAQARLQFDWWNKSVCA